jgi:hypothetical protein
VSDIPYIQQAQEVKITGQDSGGTTVNYVSADTNGNLLVKDYADGTPGDGLPAVATQVGGTDGTTFRTITTDASGNQKAVGNVASASADSGNPVKTGAVFNTSLPTVTNGQRVDTQADLNGRLLTASTPLDGYKATYSCAILDLTVATTPTDVVTMQGSSTKTIRVLKITIDAIQNTSATRNLLLIKRSSANTGGTSSSQTIVPHDSSAAATTATILAYTANPSALGTNVGNIRTAKIQQLATNVTNPLDHIVWDFGNRPGQALVLRGTSEFLAINLNSVTSSNNSLNINIEFTEE